MHNASHQIIPDLRKMNSDSPSLSASLVGGRVRPRCLFADPLSSPAASHGEVPEADNEAIPMAPSKQRCSYVLDDGPCSEIHEEGLMAILRRYAIHSLVPLSLNALLTGDRTRWPSLRHTWWQLTPLSLRTLMSIQVLGEFYGLDMRIHEVLYSYYFALLTIMPGFYHLQPRDGTPLVEEPSRGTRGNYPFGNNWNSRYAFMKIQEPFFYPTFWRTVDVARPVSFLGEAVAKQVLAISWCFRRVPFLVSKEVLLHSRLWGNIARLPASVLHDEYQQAGRRRRRSFYTPPPRLARETPPTAGIRLESVGTPTGGGPLMGIQQRLLTELFFIRNREWLEGRTEHWDPEEEYRHHLLWSEGLGRHSGGFSQVSLRSVAESRVSAALFLVLVSLGFQDRNLSSDDIGFGGLSGDPEFGPGVIKNLEVYLFQFKGPYSACLNEAATDTCWDFAFCRSEAGHYRVPALHAASAGSHYQT
ncbi:hypothetical protein DY000_02007479 [Brassica cretica]|uniref:Uncharacterized protein n=1 Tax=Brassica cretica TaxID=69181 RepID=A0ABQ7CAN9_BRACR|nr:hypothetical protein DY000_02007479 [Brassica cretica]